MLTSFQRANIRYINVGLETGSEHLRRHVLHRPSYTNEDIVWFCDIVKTYNIKSNLYVLIGLPDETLQDFWETIAVSRNCNPGKIFFGIFYPYPGTDLHRLAAEKGYFRPDQIDSRAERSRVVLNMPGFSRRQIYWYYHLFYFYVYRGIWPLHKIMVHVVWTFVKSYPAIHSIAKKVINRNRYLMALLNRYKMVKVSDL
jgi:radical SAM superfamily enzyme YgiQ (UPF0313 family)